MFQGHGAQPPQITLSGRGDARVIGIIPHQIITKDLRIGLDTADIPDIDRDLLKSVVCSRYHPSHAAAGIVTGFGIREGAIATSVAHDAHNIVAVGTHDDEILHAICEVIRYNGAMTACCGRRVTTLPLPCAGLMSDQPAENVVRLLDALRDQTDAMGSIPEPFMYLSFLALTVIPALRLTERGLFVHSSSSVMVPLFS